MKDIIKTRIKSLDFGVIYLESKVVKGEQYYTIALKVLDIIIKVKKNRKDIFNAFIKIDKPKDINKNENLSRIEDYISNKMLTHIMLHNKRLINYIN